ncbi:hypothetical protein [Pseudomonas guariconensis]|uniref:hypothetical protein n=1 Tax=Pseudomonas guariconensis TaxID=1288410 RepID=UPI002FE50615
MNTVCTTPATPLTPAELQAVELRKEGMTLEKIRDITDIPDRRLRALVKGVKKGKKPPTKVAKTPTALNRTIERVFPLASRKHGIRDYELRSILHEEYGTTWDTSTGQYRSTFNRDTIARVKLKVRQRAVEEGCKVIFAMDWIDEDAPRSSSQFLIEAATDLLSRINECVTEYMATHGTKQADKSEAAELARRKQRFSVEQHLLKLAISNYTAEPVEILLNRTATLIGDLEANPDLPLGENLDTDQRKVDKPKYFPEPSGVDHFLDYAEKQRWLL